SVHRQEAVSAGVARDRAAAGGRAVQAGPAADRRVPERNAGWAGGESNARGSGAVRGAHRTDPSGPEVVGLSDRGCAVSGQSGASAADLRREGGAGDRFCDAAGGGRRAGAGRRSEAGAGELGEGGGRFVLDGGAEEGSEREELRSGRG